MSLSYALYCTGFAASAQDLGMFESLTALMTAANEDFLCKGQEVGMLLSLEWNDQGAKVWTRPAEDETPEMVWGYVIIR